MRSSALIYIAQTLPGAYEHTSGRENEDAYLLIPEQATALPPKGLLVAMLDGISSGGYGAAAARAACAAIQVRWSMVPDGDTLSDPLELVYQLLLAAQNAVLGRVERGRGGTTCLLVLIRGGLLTFGHVGDCQLLYRRLPAGFVAITQDQTALLRTQRGRDIKRIVEQSEHRGEPIADDQIAAYAQLENTLTRYLGKSDLPPDPRQWVEAGQAQLRQGDLLLLCTDGLLKARSLADLDHDLPVASATLVAGLLAQIEQSYKQDRDDTTLCLIEVQAPLPAAEVLKQYLPTFLPLLGEEDGGAPIRRDATITEDLSDELAVMVASANAPPSTPEQILGALLNAPAAPHVSTRLVWRATATILLLILIGVLLISIMLLRQP
jgi:serine/threonine protein phosphatase PrpC